MFIEQSLQLLKDNNQKITKTRRWILEQFSSITQPINAYEFLKKSEQSTIDLTTIYRNFELFESLGIIHKVQSIGGYVPCLHDHIECNQSHDLIICNNCNSINETHINIDTKKIL